MKKIINSLLFTSLPIMLTGCFEPENAPSKANQTNKKTAPTNNSPSKKPIPKKEVTKNLQGTFNIAIAGTNFQVENEGKNLYQAIKRYTQDIVTNSAGFEYLRRPSGLVLRRATNLFESELVKDYDSLIEFFKNIISDTEDELSNEKPITINNLQVPVFNELISSYKASILSLMEQNNLLTGFENNIESQDYDQITNATLGSKTYLSYLKKHPLAWILNQILKTDANPNPIIWTSNKFVFDGTYNGKKLKIIFANKDIDKTVNYVKFFEKKIKTFKSKYNISSLFIKVKDQIHNNKYFYNLLKKENYFKTENIFMIGQSKHSSLVSKFAQSNISTAIYNKYIANYIAGFQAAIASIKYNTQSKEFLNTRTSFFIGALDNYETRKLAIAFRKGVLAASDHKVYGKYLTAKFVSTSLDPTGKNSLSYSVDDWKLNNKIYQIASRSSFLDSDHQIIYIAGTTAKDWRGTSNDTNNNQVDIRDQKHLGLIGSLYNYDTIKNDNTLYSDLKNWNFSKNIGLILNKYDLEKNNEDSLSGNNTVLQRHNLKLLGSVGGEGLGTWVYAQLAIRGMYYGYNKRNFYGRHFLFGAPLRINDNNVFNQSKYQFIYDGNIADELYWPSLWAVFNQIYSPSSLSSSSENWL